jgi:hypothetical protein
MTTDVKMKKTHQWNKVANMQRSVCRVHSEIYDATLLKVLFQNFRTER